MMTPAEALRVLAAHTAPPGDVEMIPLSGSLGRVLARDIVSDVDMPPFDRSAMDGFAVRAADVAAVPAELEIVEEIRAGESPRRRIGAGECARIMTGAPVPEGADAVVMVERTAPAGPRRVRILEAVSCGESIQPRAEDVARGNVVLRARAAIRPQEVAMLASVGAVPVPVYAALSVAVIPTGDELVAPEVRPEPGRIRESNGAMLSAQVRALGPGVSCDLFAPARDTEASLHEAVERALARDVVVLSGGVSMGDYDLVGRHLRQRGLEVHIEKVAIKPGKPLLFGVLKTGGRPKTVFGLPGNPVSSFVTFEVFVKPHLRGRMGLAPPHGVVTTARLGGARGLRPGNRTQYVPALVTAGEAGLSAVPVPWHGSADLAGITAANGFIILDAGGEPPVAGGAVGVHLLEPQILRPAPACGDRTLGDAP